MRQIKFRVWNGEQMISPDYVNRDGLAHWKENSIPQCSNELMQFTGLKDKNGLDIYEGDIVSDGGIIEWNEDDCSFNLNYPNIEYQQLNKYDILDWLEVVGNIYEKPEQCNK